MAKTPWSGVELPSLTQVWIFTKDEFAKHNAPTRFHQATRRSFANICQPDPSPLLLFTLDQHILCCASDDQCDSMWHAGSHEKLVMIIWDADENVVRLLFPLREDAGYCSASASWFCFFYVTYIIIYYNICITIYEILYNICIQYSFFHVFSFSVGVFVFLCKRYF